MSSSGGGDGFAESEEFFRRIPHWLFDSTTEKIHYRAFENDKDSDRFSVNWKRHSSENATLNGFPGFRIYLFSAAQFHEKAQLIDHSPEPDNYSHCDVIGHKPMSVRKYLRNEGKLLPEIGS